MHSLTINNQPAASRYSGIEDFDVQPSGINICQACAHTGRTCCQGHEIYVTRGDCRRIAGHTGRVDFFEYHPCNIDAYADQADDPLWQRHVFRSDGTRRILKRHVDGDCRFLTQNGCCLPLTVRPLICRLYPHLYTAAGISGIWDSECLATRINPAAVIETEIAGVGQSEAAQWHHMLYEEIEWEDRRDENWTDL